MQKKQPSNQQIFDLLLETNVRLQRVEEKTVKIDKIDKIDTVETKLEKLENDVSKLQTDVTTLQTIVVRNEENVSKLQTDVTKMKSDLSTVQDGVTWLVGEKKKDDEEKTVADFRQSEHTDQIDKLDQRMTRVEDHLKLPQMQFSF